MILFIKLIHQKLVIFVSNFKKQTYTNTIFTLKKIIKSKIIYICNKRDKNKTLYMTRFKNEKLI